MINNKKKLISIPDLFKESWELFKQGFWRLLALKGINFGINIGLGILLIIVIIITIITYHVNIPEIPTGFNLQGSAAIGWRMITIINRFAWPLIAGLIFLLAFLIVGFWITASSLVMVSGIKQDMKIKTALKIGWKKIASLAWISVLVGLISGVGFLFFMVPGIIFSVWFAFAGYIFICEGIRGWSALKASKRLVDGYFWQVFARLFLLKAIMLGLLLMNEIARGISLIGMFFLSLFSLVYVYVLYRDLSKAKS